MLRAAARRLPSAVWAQGSRAFTRSAIRAGGAGPPLQPFKRLAMPEEPLVEDHELIWDDGVAPETCLDLDAAHIPTSEALAWWLGGFAFFFGVYQVIALTSPESRNPAVNKAETMPDLGLSFIKTGGSKAAGDDSEAEEEE